MMSDLSSAVLESFDALAIELRKFDEQTEGGFYLLCSSEFNQKARETLPAQERDRVFEVAHTIHDFLKGLPSPRYWSGWFCNSYGHTTPKNKLNASLEEAQKLLVQCSFNHVVECNPLVVECNPLTAHFFDNGAMRADDLAHTRKPAL